MRRQTKVSGVSNEIKMAAEAKVRHVLLFQIWFLVKRILIIERKLSNRKN